MQTCECGCGEYTNVYRGTPRRYLHGHSGNRTNVDGLKAAAAAYKARHRDALVRELQERIAASTVNGRVSVQKLLGLVLEERHKGYIRGWTAHYQRTRRGRA